MKSDLSKDVEMAPDFETIIMMSSDETPKHRNNFIKLAVVKGMDVVDSIAAVETDTLDKPINDVRIISARMIKRKLYN